MKKKLSIFLSTILFLQIFNIFIVEKVEAAPPTKTIIHTIIASSWDYSKVEGPAYYDYDDGLWYGRLYKTNTTWESRRQSNTDYRTGYRNSKFDESNPSSIWSFSYIKSTIEQDGLQNVVVTSMSWDGSNQGPGEYTFQSYVGTYPNGSWETMGPYKHKRSFKSYYDYDTYKYTSNYSGTLTARTNPPIVSILTPKLNSRHHNQDKIIVEGYVKDEDVGDKNTIHYNIVGTSHLNKDVILTNPTQIIATGNDTYFKGYIQLDQTISPGEYKLEVWARDDKGADSNVVERQIIVFNLLEDILNKMKNYTLKQDEFQLVVVNSDAPIIKSNINDNFIETIKQELINKKIKLYFIGKAESQNYINTNLFQN